MSHGSESNRCMGEKLVWRHVGILKELSHQGEKQRQIGTQMLPLRQTDWANAITQNAL